MELLQVDRPWNVMENWHLVLPPNRPPPSFLSLIKRLLSSMDRSLPVAVLGSTPEFRDLLAQLDFRQIYVLDKYRDFYRRMASLRAYSNPEIFVEGDWLSTLPSFEGRFGAILSDLTSGNIPYESRAEFYGNIAGALSRDGIFIDRILTNERALADLEALDREYREAPLNLLTANYFSAAYLFSSALLSSRSAVDSTEFYDILERRFGHPRLKFLVAMSQLITPRGFVWYYGRPWAMLASEYFSYWRILESHEDGHGTPFEGRTIALVSTAQP